MAKLDEECQSLQIVNKYESRNDLKSQNNKIS